MVINNFKDEHAFLSNFYPMRLDINGVTYDSVEHFYQSKKTIDSKDKLLIIEARTASIAKKLGRHIVLRGDWDEIKDSVMMEALKVKFDKPFYGLGRKLCLTYPFELIEGNNWHDNYWGMCYCKKCQGKGQNKLGKMLMEVRKTLVFAGHMMEVRTT